MRQHALLLLVLLLTGCSTFMGIPLTNDAATDLENGRTNVTEDVNR
jgi:hypothetical protein